MIGFILETATPNSSLDIKATTVPVEGRLRSGT